jgi:hypothetical protein
MLTCQCPTYHRQLVLPGGLGSIPKTQGQCCDPSTQLYSRCFCLFAVVLLDLEEKHPGDPEDVWTWRWTEMVAPEAQAVRSECPTLSPAHSQATDRDLPTSVATTNTMNSPVVSSAFATLHYRKLTPCHPNPLPH